MNEKSLDSRLNYGEPEDETDGATALAQRRSRRFTQYEPVQSTIGGEDPEWQGAWSEEHHDASNPAAWKAHIDAVGADYSDSAHTAGPITPNESPNAWESSYAQKSKAHRKRIYPVADSSSYISPYV